MKNDDGLVNLIKYGRYDEIPISNVINSVYKNAVKSDDVRFSLFTTIINMGIKKV